MGLGGSGGDAAAEEVVVAGEDAGTEGEGEDEATVRRGYEFAIAAGAEILHEPRLWPEYGPGYYAVFIRDSAGNNLELKCRVSTERPTP
jgi:hypothetical protein